MEVCHEVQSTRNNTADIADVFRGKLEQALKVKSSTNWDFMPTI